MPLDLHAAGGDVPVQVKVMRVRPYVGMDLHAAVVDGSRAMGRLLQPAL